MLDHPEKNKFSILSFSNKDILQLFYHYVHLFTDK